MHWVRQIYQAAYIHTSLEFQHVPNETVRMYPQAIPPNSTIHKGIIPLKQIF